MIKVERLGLPRRKGLFYAVSRTEVLATEHGKTKVARRLRGKQDPQFLYFIDDDGDLARAFNGDTPKNVRARRALRAAHPTRPASATLDADALFKCVLEIVDPPTSLELACGGVARDARTRAESHAIYDREWRRLADIMEVVFGPPLVSAGGAGSREAVWRVNGCLLALTSVIEDADLPTTISLVRVSDEHLAAVEAKRRTAKPVKATKRRT